MSSNKKKPQQSNLFSFFQKKTREPITVDLDLNDKNGDGENSVVEKSLSKSTINFDQGHYKQSPLVGSGNTEKRKFLHEDDDSDSTISCKNSAKKRRRIIYSSEEDDDDVLNEPKIETISTSSNQKSPSTQRALHKNSISTNDSFATSFINSFNFDDDADENINCSTSTVLNTKVDNSAGGLLDEKNSERFPHLGFKFLQPENLKDARGRSITDPNYDQTTLYIPEDFLRKQTPGHQQWWKLKALHFDTILFFKVGKFYELYHWDAVIAVENLGLTYMRGNIAHCGFPEIGYGRFSDQLLNRGYKVARVEQTETPKQLEDRCRKTNTKEKVVRRELCRITTAATKTFGVLDGTDNRELDGSSDPYPNWLMALTEGQNGEGHQTYGVCFIDCSVGEFKLGQFTDDSNRSQLRSLFAHNYPKTLLIPKNNLSPVTLALLNNMLANVSKEYLAPKRQFLTAEDTLTMLADDIYLGSNVAENWPEALKDKLTDVNASIPIPNTESKGAIQSLGAILWYLKNCLIDVDMVTMKKFLAYSPLPLTNRVRFGSSLTEMSWKNKLMVLDGTSLMNLQILPSSLLLGGGQRRLANPSQVPLSMNFSLFSTICFCRTAFGKRLLRHWISAPLCDPSEISKRHEAIRWLMNSETSAFVDQATDLLKKIPDLENLFQRIHTIGLKYRAESHPDARAQMFESVKYNKRKIKDLFIALSGLEQIQRLMAAYAKHLKAAENIPSKHSLLNTCLNVETNALRDDLCHFKNAFDHKECMDSGSIMPKRGVDPEFDTALEDVLSCEHELEDYMADQKKELRSSAIKFIHSGKTRYQMEIPDSIRVPSDFELTSQRKGFKRYLTSELKKLVQNLSESESRRDQIIADSTRRVFADFDSRKSKWAFIVGNIAIIDALLSLVQYARSSSQFMCFPEFISNETPILEIRKGYHPCLISGKSKIRGASEYIPNDCSLGGSKASIMLLTGPNMGGKSTYMRQISSLVVLAQIGSLVPASEMRLTPVDRIFCRIGASDRLTAGQSTFYVELSETQIILNQATQNSLVLIDELGRGTSTHDGTAIACAVLKYITSEICCRTLFSTHYHALCKFINESPQITFAHMACMVENANIDDPSMENITFLYSLTPGLCDKSYGFYTAKMAGIDIEIVRKAFAATRLINNEDNQESINTKLKALYQAALDKSVEEKALQNILEQILSTL